MDPQTYIETDTDLQAAQCREWLGREYARSVNAAYPIPPDTWPGMNDAPPAPPPVGSYALYWIDPLPKIGGGGVFVLTDAIVATATQSQTLSNGVSYNADISTNAKTFAQLTPEGQAAATPPPPPDPFS